MTTNYEEACRRVGTTVALIEASVATGRIAKEVGGEVINVYRAEILNLQQVYLSSDCESPLYRELHAPYAGSATVCSIESTVTLDYVTGLIGIGPECTIPNDLFAQVA
jgi:hypothetical protein